MPVFNAPTAALDVVVRTSWGSGLVADLSLTPEQAVNGWTVEFEYDGEIVNIWNATIIAREGNRYVVENVGYNATVGAGATTLFGFQGSGTSTAITPVRINGEAIGDGDGGDAPVPLPTVSVADTVASEEDGSIDFVVTLSAASASDVIISYETVAGSAGAGPDFVGASGQVTVPAGQLSAVVSVSLVDDDTAEDAEQLELRLTSAEGAEIADGTALGQITDTDLPAPIDPPPPPADPAPSIGNASTLEGDPGTGSGQVASGLIADGPLVTSGNQILDANGDAVQIRAVNWFGAENDVRAPHGLWQRPMTDMMDQMVAEGFNAIRLPFSVQNVLEDQVATAVNGDPSLAGLTTLQIFDRIVEYAEEIGIKIILDAHRVTQGNGAEGIWYAGAYDEEDWIEAWEILGNRYGDSSAIIGADLLNEPHLGTWGTGQRNDWAQAAEQAGNAVLDVAPDWLILVEGIGTYQGEGYWWGGQLQGVRDRPVQLNADNKLVYSPHDYPPSVFNQSWFNDGSNLYDVFRENWGFIFEEGLAPILLGEFGSKLENPADQPWAEAITTYLGGDFDGDGTNDLGAGQAGPSFAWWSWNPNSGDTGGYVLDDWVTVRQGAADLLAPLLADQEGNGTPGDGPVSEPTFLAFDIVLEAPAPQDVTLTYETRDGSATAGADYVAATGTVSFAAGQQTAQIQVQILPDTEAEGDETFTVVLSDVTGNELAVATGTILNDDAAAPAGPDPVDPDPVDPPPTDPEPGPVDPDPVDPDPVDTDPVDPPHQHPMPSEFIDITTFGNFHGTSSHT
ncbi:MAG: cellulase family glycosylhydrolase, partial [Pseudomonadota bacterium]